MFKDIYIKLKKEFVFPHLIFWAVSIVLFAVLLIYTRDFSLSGIDLKTAVNFFITLIFLAISVYINILWLIPSFLKKRRFFFFIILEIGNIVLFILLNYGISLVIEEANPNFLNEVIAEFILVTLFLIITTLLTFTRDSMALQDAQIRIKEAERQKIEAELRALKSQVNPHFFFNTLNSLYSLSLDKSDKAPEMILKLSDLMRYLIYETRDDLVPINKQLEFLRSYVYLEKLRSPESLELKFDIRGDHLETPADPLLFIAFVENAFKHGMKAANKHAFIRIFFDLTVAGKILFSVENNYEPKLRETGDKEGIGLANTKKRLDLLYPGRHQLAIEDDNDIFRVKLQISIR
jgi:two-component system, LytTR family, sensor kinase